MLDFDGKSTRLASAGASLAHNFHVRRYITDPPGCWFLQPPTTFVHRATNLPLSRMTETQTITVPDPEQSAPDKAKLLVRLDASLEQYLNILDQYEQAQKQLATLLASVRNTTLTTM